MKFLVLGFVLLIALVLGLLLAFPFMWLWNGAVCLALTIAKPGLLVDDLHQLFCCGL